MKPARKACKDDAQDQYHSFFSSETCPVDSFIGSMDKVAPVTGKVLDECSMEGRTKPLNLVPGLLSKAFHKFLLKSLCA